MTFQGPTENRSTYIRMCQTHPCCYPELIDLRSLVPEYVQELEDEFNPEVIAFLMDRNHEYSNISSHWTKVHAQTHQLEAFLCERNFPDYAERESFLASQRKLLTLRSQSWTATLCNVPSFKGPNHKLRTSSKSTLAQSISKTLWDNRLYT